jgi:hypothetical protein
MQAAFQRAAVIRVTVDADSRGATASWQDCGT